MISPPVKRLIAYALDAIANFFVFTLVCFFIGFPAIFFSGLSINNLEMLKNSHVLGGIAGGIYIMYALILLASIIFIQVYFWNKSTSIGKMILKMKVVDGETHMPVGLFRMVLRELVGKQVSGALGGLGYAWIIIDKSNQSWHDKIFDTMVVNDNVATCWGVDVIE